MLLKFVPLLVAAIVVSAENHIIKAGPGDTYAFEPAKLTAQPGDTLEFRFYPPLHNVIMGRLDEACRPAAEGGFYSGDIEVGKGQEMGDMVFRVTVNDTNPIFFYCSVGPHCKLGMYGVVNPNEDQTLEVYADLARAYDGDGDGGDGGVHFGGVLQPAGPTSATPDPNENVESMSAGRRKKSGSNKGNNTTSKDDEPSDDSAGGRVQATKVVTAVVGVLGVGVALILMA